MCVYKKNSHPCTCTQFDRDAGKCMVSHVLTCVSEQLNHFFIPKQQC